MGLWNVWRVHYMTYAEIAAQGEKPAELVGRRLSFERAQRMVDDLGFGYCMKPAEG